MQQVMYSGYTKTHCFAFHIVTGPDGMIWHVSGPHTGHFNDLNVLDASQLQQKMGDLPGMSSVKHLVMRTHNDFDIFFSSSIVMHAAVYKQGPGPAAATFKLYCDSIYSTIGFLVAPQKGANISQLQRNFNGRMSAYRISVEWSIGKVYTINSILTRRNLLEVGRDQLTARLYVSLLLTNIHTCLYGCQVSLLLHCTIIAMSAGFMPCQHRDGPVVAFDCLFACCRLQCTSALNLQVWKRTCCQCFHRT
jgi:hypothetical protein